ncbi:MAG: hypothetical protein FJ295_10700 [Planctomycetes bacterium]|nr:hypothetical protein [Planctomycetota bacterium]
MDASASGLQVACPNCCGVITVPDLSGVVAEDSGPVDEPSAPSPTSSIMVDLGCPHCAGIFKVTDSMEGQQVACPHCQGIVTVPMLTQAAVPEVIEAAHEELPPAVTSNLAPLPQAPVVPEQPTPFPTQPTPPLSPPLSPPYQPSAGVPDSHSTALDRPAAVVIPTEDGGYVALRDPVKTIGRPGQEIELRQLSPEEKRQRRRITNIIVITACMLILLITFVVLKSR